MMLLEVRLFVNSEHVKLHEFRECHRQSSTVPRCPEQCHAFNLLATTPAGSTVIWSIADLDTTTHEMSYSIDMCDCSHIGVAVETLESTSYADDTTSPDVFPLMPKSLAVEVVDSSELCGPPSIALGEMRCFEEGGG